MSYRLDEIDKRILFYLAADARKTSAPDIADEVNVSAGTIRNRIRQLEEHGIIEGYHTHINYERGDGLLRNLFFCTTAKQDREVLVQQVCQIPGVINVRELRAGREDLQIEAAGTDTEDLERISRALMDLAIEIEDEKLVQREHFRPYQPYGPEETRQSPSIMSFMSLAGDAEVVELTVGQSAPVARRTLREANEDGLLDEDTLIVAIERDGEMISPRGQTTLEAGDVVTIFNNGGIESSLKSVFNGEEIVQQ